MRRSVLFLGLTLIAAGTFSAWLPHEAAGLSYIGLEMGELAKFLPQVRSGAISPGRSIFYLPPVALGLILILVSSRWGERRWQTWLARFLGVAVSLLAFPAFEAFGTEAEEWLWRTLMIGFVLICAMFSPLLRKLPEQIIWATVALVALAGGGLPFWLLLQVNRAYASIYQPEVAVGVGALLNLTGQLLVAGTAVVFWRVSPSS